MRVSSFQILTQRFHFVQYLHDLSSSEQKPNTNNVKNRLSTICFHDFEIQPFSVVFKLITQKEERRKKLEEFKLIMSLREKLKRMTKS